MCVVLGLTGCMQSCVLLNHLLSRLRVSLSDVTGGMEQDPLLSRCFCCPRGASTVERPELAFKVRERAGWLSTDRPPAAKSPAAH